MHSLRALATIIAAATLLSACGKSEISTGPVRTETRPVGEFSAIEVEGATHLEITVGVPASLEVEGRETFLHRLESEVRDGTLHIKSSRKDWVAIGTSPRITIRVGVPTLKDLTLQGGNDVRLSGFNGGSTSVRMEGAVNMRGTGHLDELKIFMAGAGHADMSELTASAADVTVAGVGSVIVHPQETFNATMNGVGAIFYTGNPRQVNTRMNGLGTIGHRPQGKQKAPEEKQPIDPDSLQPEYETDPANTTTGVI